MTKKAKKQSNAKKAGKSKDARPKGRKRGARSAVVDTRVIYCGDNLVQLGLLPDACVDLVYIDPPFNSNRNYEVFWGETREKRAFADRHASTQAYIEFMRPRCVELHRVLKDTGSFYFHCDWHAGHYVKVMLDQIFGENQFQNDVVWKRTHAHGSARKFGPVHDTIFLYTKTTDYAWTHPKVPHDPQYTETHFNSVDEKTGRRFQPISLTGSGIRSGESGKPWRRVNPTEVNRHWAIPGQVMSRHGLKGRTVQEKLDALDRAGLVYWPKEGGGTPRLKWFADELEGMAMPDVWTDIAPISANANERLGYPTQKPLALLERIIKASSNEGDVVLDAFCGCGTALVAAENLGRQWIGIDVSPTACRVMAKRLRDVCMLPEDNALWKIGRGFVARGLPWSEHQLRKIPPFEFENWAVISLGGVPNVTQTGDSGIDGRVYPVGSAPAQPKGGQTELGFMDDWYPVQVKQKDKVGRPDIDSFEAAMLRANRKKGFFVAFDYTRDALTEIDRFFTKQHTIILPITVDDILKHQIARKLA